MSVGVKEVLCGTDVHHVGRQEGEGALFKPITSFLVGGGGGGGGGSERERM